ncbi:hypothetical protein [Nannocystis sp. SCPEA4]|nr:hypothetical protein [Nannocystis sp. SCPEA4]MCY1061118.1 hypothetical protein [Nannocystis sp. SCPEA4]
MDPLAADEESNEDERALFLIQLEASPRASAFTTVPGADGWF